VDLSLPDQGDALYWGWWCQRKTDRTFVKVTK
jgi:hypothetical protein